MSSATKETTAAKSNSLAVPEILSTVSHEVRLLTDGVSDIQELVGNLVVAGAFGGSHSLYELQALDRLCQNLDGIADFLAAISKLSSRDWTIDVSEASRAVKVAELGGRLGGASAGELGVTTGEFEAFDELPLAG